MALRSSPLGLRHRAWTPALLALALAAACGRSTLYGEVAGAGSDASTSGVGGSATTSVTTSVTTSTTSVTTSVTSGTTTTTVSSTTSTTSTGCVPTPEVCDGLDNDCDGIIDNGNPGGGFACNTGLPGVCAAGVASCKDAVLVCAQSMSAGPEICDGLDNDCDGIIDDGCTPGCSDGSREGFLDVSLYPKIAACSGGFTVPGLLSTLTPECNHKAGNSSGNPTGVGCSVADLCAVGFHVCTGPAEVAALSPTACAGAAPAPNLFFATRQSSNGCNACALGTNTNPNVCNGQTCAGGCAQTMLTANDFYGCGSMGTQVDTCSIFNRASGNECGGLTPPWSCPGGFVEANTVQKPGSAGGGVLCCAD